MRLPLIALFALAACGGKKDSGPGKDWSGKPLDVTIENKVNNVGFTITAPKGMKLTGSDTPEDVIKQWEADLEDQWSEPGFMVAYESIPPKDLPGFIEDLMVGEDIVAKQEATADGFVAVHHTKDKGQVVVNVLKKKGDHTLTCRASQAKDGGVPNPDKTIAWLEKLCGSLTIQ